MIAMLTIDGTATHETALCSRHDTVDNRRRLEERAPGDVVPGSWANVDGNDYIVCALCGEFEDASLDDPNHELRADMRTIREQGTP